VRPLSFCAVDGMCDSASRSKVASHNVPHAPAVTGSQRLDLMTQTNGELPQDSNTADKAVTVVHPRRSTRPEPRGVHPWNRLLSP
jgi:hypothetical protein